LSNQFILWLIIIIPWLTLIVMGKENAKRYLPVGLFAAFTSSIIIETGITLQWWAVLETAYPLKSIAYLFGLLPVMTMWIFRYTFGNFLLYIGVDAISNITFTFLYLGIFLSNRGIFQYVAVSPFQTFLMTTVHGFALYGYQIWQEGIFVRSR